MSFRKNYEILIGKANTDLKSAEILYGAKDDEIDKLKFLLGTSYCVGNSLKIGISTCILYKKLYTTYI